MIVRRSLPNQTGGTGLIFSLSLFNTREGIKSVVNNGSQLASLNANFWPETKELPGTTETDVRVRVGRRIVQIQSERPGVGAIVPIATADEGVRSV